MGPTPVPEKKNACLEVSDGKSADIELLRMTSQRRAYQIVFKKSQPQADRKKSKMHVYKVPKECGSVHMAFCFKVKNKDYFPVVERDSKKKVCFKIKQIRKKDDVLKNGFLFEWVTNGEYGGLRSVAEPKKFLHVHDDKATLSSEPDFGFRVQLL